MTSVEKDRIADQEINSRRLRVEEDYHAIRAAIDDLNQGTMRLAELMMDTAVTTALKGKTMDEADMGEGPKPAIPWPKQTSSKQVVDFGKPGTLVSGVP